VAAATSTKRVSPSTVIDATVVDELAAAFHTHADQFDSLYAGQIPVDAE